MRSILVLVLMTASAHADRYIIQRGETLEHVATAHGCSVEALQRANGLRTTLVKAGTEIDVPACSLRSRARVRTTTRAKPVDDDEKAKAALAVIDGATWMPPPAPAPTRGGFEPLAQGDGYELRRPSRAYGAPNVIEHLRSTIAVVRALYPEVHTLAIGDISAEHGGKLDNHVSHKTGLDVDVGFYFKKVPDGYPDRFVDANATLDLEATWALLTAFARTQDADDGVGIIFLDYAVQKKLYDWAHARGTPDEDLAQLLQYPRGKDAGGLVRHWPNHADHMHVRFKAKR
ncbi:MAG TPA: penicillin-insensitive murein endopeptidase [Kofleriaceae bacterium]|nr:penicillin-insensitive murein endopeptidase [Kofleriaceae bacterium]